MIKNLSELQINAKYANFAIRLTEALRSKNIEPTPVAFASAFNKAHYSENLKPHTVRKWLLGKTQPRSETLLRLSNWLGVEPVYLFSSAKNVSSQKNSKDFEILDQEVIAKYLSMPTKQKYAIRLLIESFTDLD